MTRRKLIRALAAAALLVAAAAAWLALAPRQLGGSASYAVVYGTSMEPKFHGDDLVIVRRAASYGPGDVVLYRNRELGREVLHRIVAVQDGRYVIKGDNNRFLDRPHASPGDVEGKLWLHIPAGGRPLQWVRTPLHAAVIFGLLALLVAGGGGTSAIRGRERTRPRRERRSRPANLPSERSLLVGLAAAGAVAFVAVALAALAFGKPLRHDVPVTHLYGQTGQLAYSATTAPGPAYPDGRVPSGAAIFLKVVDRVHLRFAYRFRSEEPHGVAGRASMTATLSDGSGWARALPLEAARRFRGDTTTLSGTLDLRRLQALVRGLVTETGTDAGSYTLTVRPRVRAAGVVGGKPVRDTLASSFAFHLDAVRLSPLGGSGSAAPAFRVTHWTPGLRSASNTLSLLGLSLDVARSRDMATALFALALVGLLGAGCLLLRVHRADEESRIQSRFGAWLVTVSEAPARPRLHIVRVDSFESLVRLADRYGRMILDEGGRFVVEEGRTSYVYEVEPEVPGEAPAYGWGAAKPAADGWTT